MNVVISTILPEYCNRRGGGKLVRNLLKKKKNETKNNLMELMHVNYIEQCYAWHFLQPNAPIVCLWLSATLQQAKHFRFYTFIQPPNPSRWR